MTSFREIPVNIITHDTVMGRSMHNIDHEAHERLSSQMREWERNNKVTVVPMGASADISVSKEKSSIGGRIAAQSKKANARIKAATEIVRNKRNLAGHQNLVLVSGGKYKVSIAGVFVGVFEKDQAIIERDKYRTRNNLPMAEY